MFLPTFMSHVHRIPYKESSIFPVQTADQLLKGKDQKNLIMRFQDQIGLPLKIYATFYKPLFEQFAEFVQILPLSQGRALGEILNIGLERALICLELLREEGILDNNPLLTYVMVSSSLLKDIGRVSYDRRIVITDTYGQFEREWMPCESSMLSKGKYFKIYALKALPPHYLFQMCTVIYARQIIPKVGFRWIAQDAYLLTAWFSLLTGDTEETGGLSDRLDRVQKLLKRLIESRLKPLPIITKVYEPKETAAGHAFWKWLREGLITGDIPINDDEFGVYYTEEGLLIEGPAIFKRFGRVYSQSIEWRVLYQQFNAMGLTKLSGYDYKFDQYFSKTPETVSRENQKNKQSYAGSVNQSGLFSHKKIHLKANLSKQNQKWKELKLLIPSIYLIYTHKNKPKQILKKPCIGLHREGLLSRMQRLNEEEHFIFNQDNHS